MGTVGQVFATSRPIIQLRIVAKDPLLRDLRPGLVITLCHNAKGLNPSRGSHSLWSSYNNPPIAAKCYIPVTICFLKHGRLDTAPFNVTLKYTVMLL